MHESECFYSYHLIAPISMADLEEGGGGLGVATPLSFLISKIKGSNKTKQKIEDNHLEKELHVCQVFVYTR